MIRYNHHIFVCTNERDPSDPKGCCSAKGSQEVLQEFRKEIENRNLKGKVRANKAGCLDLCSFGPTVVIYPEGTWYAKVQASDVRELFDAILAGRVVERLRYCRFV